MLLNGANTKSIPEVWASTFYEVSKSASYEDVEKEKTGERKKVYSISFYDKNYTIRRNINYNNYVIENKEHKLSIGDYTFPLKIKVSTFYETKNVKVKKDKEKLKKELSENVLKELEYIIPASARIVKVDHDYKVNKNILEYRVTVQASENIAKLYPLSKSEAEQIIKQQNNSTDTEEPIPSNPEKRPINDIRNEFEDKNNSKEQNDTKDEN